MCTFFFFNFYFPSYIASSNKVSHFLINDSTALTVREWNIGNIIMYSEQRHCSECSHIGPITKHPKPKMKVTSSFIWQLHCPFSVMIDRTMVEGSRELGLEYGDVGISVESSLAPLCLALKWDILDGSFYPLLHFFHRHRKNRIFGLVSFYS